MVHVVCTFVVLPDLWTVPDGGDAKASGVIEKSGQKSEIPRYDKKDKSKSELKRTKKCTTSLNYQGAKVPSAKEVTPLYILFLKISIL